MLKKGSNFAGSLIPLGRVVREKSARELISVPRESKSTGRTTQSLGTDSAPWTMRGAYKAAIRLPSAERASPSSTLASITHALVPWDEHRQRTY